MIETNHKQHLSATTFKPLTGEANVIDRGPRTMYAIMHSGRTLGPGLHVGVPRPIKPCHGKNEEESDPPWGRDQAVSGQFLWCSNKHVPPEGPLPSGCAGAWSAWMFAGDVSSSIHMNGRTQGFPAEYSAAARWSWLLVSTVLWS